MAWRCTGSSNLQLLENLRKSGLITSDAVFRAMKQVDRAHYCRGGSPYQDSPQYIGHGATISAPHMHAMCLEHLSSHLKEGMKALDVGSGSGYLTVCMGRMVGKTGQAYGIEHVSELVDWSIENAKKDASDLLGKNVFLCRGDGRLGLPDKAPFDCIHVGAAAPTVPEALKQQLKLGGCLVIPVGPANGAQYLMSYTRLAEKKFKEKMLTGVRYVPLTDLKRQE